MVMAVNDIDGLTQVAKPFECGTREENEALRCIGVLLSIGGIDIHSIPTEIAGMVDQDDTDPGRRAVSLEKLEGDQARADSSMQPTRQETDAVLFPIYCAVGRKNERDLNPKLREGRWQRTSHISQPPHLDIGHGLRSQEGDVLGAPRDSKVGSHPLLVEDLEVNVRKNVVVSFKLP